jgi:glyoxylase-like metal-dependent hydrolase (beta-lactamase superfamily II)
VSNLGFGGALAAAFLIALSAPPARAFGELARPEDGYFQQAEKVAPHVWLLRQPSFQVQPTGNVTVIEQSDGLVLVDAGGSPGAGRRIVQMVRTISGKPVKAVIISQWHGDKPQGLSEVLKAWPRARTIATRPTQAHLRDPRTMNTPGAPDPAANGAFQKQVAGFAAFAREQGSHATEPRMQAGWARTERLFNQYALDMDGALTLSTTEAFDERIVLADAHAPVEALFLGRADTDGDAAVWLPKQRVMVAGEIVVAPFPYGFECYPADWLQTLERLRQYPFRVLIPGHGAPQRDRTYLDRLGAAIAEVRAKVAPLAAKGLSLDQVRKEVDLTAQIQGFVGEDPWLAFWMRQYWADPVIASAYKEATGQPIIQDLKGG